VQASRILRGDFLKKSARVSLAKIVQAFGALGASLIVAVALGPKGQGEVERTLNIALLLAPLARMSGAHGAIAMHSRGRPNRLVVSSVVFISITGTLLAVLTASVLIAVTDVPVSSSMVYAAIALLALFGTREVGKALSWLRSDAAADNYASVAVALLRVSVLAIGWALGLLTSNRVVWIFVGVWTLTTIVFVSLETRRTTPLELAVDRESLVECLRTAGPVTINLLVIGLLLRMDIVVLDYFETPTAEIGRYAMGVRLAEALWLVPLAIAQVFVVDAAQSRRNRSDGPNVSQISQWSFILVSLAGLVVWAGLTQLIPRYAASYDGTQRLFLLLLPGIALYAVVPTVRNRLTLDGRLTGMTVCGAVAVALNLVLNVLFVPRFGAEGAAISTSVAYGVLVLGMLKLASRVHGSDLDELELD